MQQLGWTEMAGMTMMDTGFLAKHHVVEQEKKKGWRVRVTEPLFGDRWGCIVQHFQ